MTSENPLSNFDPNGPGIPGALFGLPFSPETSKVIMLPVPWEATVSYRTGTGHGPESILTASRQIDFFMRQIEDAWKLGIAMLPIPQNIKEESDRVRILVNQSRTVGDESAMLIGKINEASENLNIYVKNIAQKALQDGKLVGVLGGDHSSPLGLLRALSEIHDRFGILHLDAHADLRKGYEGFTYSHGSIMYNALKISSVSRLVQVGIRDLCEEEFEVMRKGMGRIKTFYDDDVKNDLDNGKSWSDLCLEIIKELPQNVYVSFDIDGLDPKLCPGTGTPVPGGLGFHQAVTLIQAVATSGRKIIGFDLCEVAHVQDDDWDANVGSRILWQLCNWMAVSQGLLRQIRN